MKTGKGIATGKEIVKTVINGRVMVGYKDDLLEDLADVTPDDRMSDIGVQAIICGIMKFDYDAKGETYSQRHDIEMQLGDYYLSYNVKVWRTVGPAYNDVDGMRRNLLNQTVDITLNGGVWDSITEIEYTLSPEQHFKICTELERQINVI